MKIKDIVRAVQQNLPITERHDTWLSENPNPRYSLQALDHAQNALGGVVGGTRTNRQPFRSSATGMCPRRRIFSAAGVPEHATIDSRLGNIFGTGNFLHLKWQMAGLTEGWLAEAEVGVDAPHLKFGGTLDGILFDGSGFEFKTINSNGFSWVMTYGPKAMHIRQVHSYMLLRSDIEAFSIVYEDKGTSDWREYRVQRDPKIIKEIDKELGELNAHYEKRTLPPMLHDCETQEGSTYRQCPFRVICPTHKKWPANGAKG